MKTDIEVKEEIIIRLDKKEAGWLKGVLQNYFGNPEDEHVQDKEKREKLFNKLKDFYGINGETVRG